MIHRYTLQFASHMKLGKGGCAYARRILDGGKQIGWEHSGRESRGHPYYCVYSLIGDEREFDNRKDFIAAYEATLALPAEPEKASP